MRGFEHLRAIGGVLAEAIGGVFHAAVLIAAGLAVIFVAYASTLPEPKAVAFCTDVVRASRGDRP